MCLVYDNPIKNWQSILWIDFYFYDADFTSDLLVIDGIKHPGHRYIRIFLREENSVNFLLTSKYPCISFPTIW